MTDIVKHPESRLSAPGIRDITSNRHYDWYGALQVVATGWNHKVLVWQDEEADTVSEYRMFSGHRCAHHHVLPFTLATDSHNFNPCSDAPNRSHELFLECVLLSIIFIVSLMFS